MVIHAAVKTRYMQPAKCAACHESMWLKAHCAKCSVCHIKFHLKCEPNLPPHCKKPQERKSSIPFVNTLAKPELSAGLSASNTDPNYVKPQRSRTPSIVVRMPSAEHMDIEPDDPNRFYRTPVIFTDQIEEHSSDDDKKKTINQYTVHEVLGRGAFGTVRRVTSKQEGHRVDYAMKEMSKKQLQRKRYGIGPNQMRNAMDDVRKEIAMLKRINHPNIIRLVEVLDDPKKDQLFMVFEKADQVSMHLGNGSESVPALDPDVAWKYFRELLAGISYLHKCRIVHRDIKPDNLLIKDGVLKITDFGVSEEVADPTNEKLTRSVGSAAFWAPEMCSADSKSYAGPPLDVWAMGVTLYAFTMGRLPYSEPSAIRLFEAIRDQSLEIPEDTDPNLKDLLVRMLDKNPETRITVPEIAEHPFVTRLGTVPLPGGLSPKMARHPGGQIKVTEEDEALAITKVDSSASRGDDDDGDA